MAQVNKVILFISC